MENTVQKQQRSVLVVDDDPMFQNMAFDAITDGNFNCVIASSGAEAMEQLTQASFDAVMIDLSMPEMDGLRLIGLIRATPGIRRVPILVATSRTDPSAIEESFKVGANDYVTKPLVWAQLPARLNNIIDRE